MGFSQPKEYRYPGTPKTLDYLGSTTPNIEQTLFDLTVPTGKKWNLLRLTVVCRFYGNYVILVNSDTIGAGRTGPASENSSFPWEGSHVANAGDTVKVYFTEVSGPVVNIESFLNLTEENV